MHKKGTGEKTYFSYKQKYPFFKKKKKKKKRKKKKEKKTHTFIK